MARPVCKWLVRSELSSLRQRIRSVGSCPGQDGDPRAPVLISRPASSAPLFLPGSPDRRSTVRPSRFHHPQTSVAARHRAGASGRSRYAAATVPASGTARPAGAPPRRSAPACWPAPPRRRSCAPGHQPAQPRAQRGLAGRQAGQGGARAVDQQLAQIPVAALADPEQPRSAAGGHLPWHQPEPGRQIPCPWRRSRRCRSRRSAPSRSARRCPGS